MPKEKKSKPLTLASVIEAVKGASYNGTVRIGGPVHLDEQHVIDAINDMALRTKFDQPNKADILLMVVLKYGLGIK